MLESRKGGDRVWKGYFGGALGGVGETAGVAAFGTEFPVALAPPSQLQACARRERISEILPTLNNASCATSW